MNKFKKNSSGLIIKIDKRLNDLDVDKLSEEKVKKANETLDKAGLPDIYYQRLREFNAKKSE